MQNPPNAFSSADTHHLSASTTWCWLRVTGTLLVQSLPNETKCEYRFLLLNEARRACENIALCGGIIRDAGLPTCKGRVFHLRTTRQFDHSAEFTSHLRLPVLPNGTCSQPPFVTALLTTVPQLDVDPSVLRASEVLVRQVARARRKSTHARRARVAVCLLGQLRQSFAQSCTVQTMVDRLIKPLDADVYVFVNSDDATSGPKGISESLGATRTRLRQLLVDTSVRAFELNSSRGQPTIACKDAEDVGGIPSGFPQSRGLAACGAHAIPQGYDWIIRGELHGFES